MKIRPAPCGQYLCRFFVGKAEQRVILGIKKVEDLVRHFQSNGADNPYLRLGLISSKPSSHQNHLMFLCFVNIFCYLEHSPV